MNEEEVRQIKVEEFQPTCVVCKGPVSQKRARSRSKDTCSPVCANVWRKYRLHLIKTSRCRACYHPSTPEERAEFIQWRRARGDKREQKGRPARDKSTVQLLADALRVIESAYRIPEWINPCRSEETDKLLDRLKRAVARGQQNLIDSKTQEEGKLAASGQKA